MLHIHSLWLVQSEHSGTGSGSGSALQVRGGPSGTPGNAPRAPQLAGGEFGGQLRAVCLRSHDPDGCALVPAHAGQRDTGGDGEWSRRGPHTCAFLPLSLIFQVPSHTPTIRTWRVRQIVFPASLLITKVTLRRQGGSTPIC